jgi:hypothetical protein
MHGGGGHKRATSGGSDAASPGRTVVAARAHARAPSGEGIAAVQIDDEVCPSLSLLSDLGRIHLHPLCLPRRSTMRALH